MTFPAPPDDDRPRKRNRRKLYLTVGLAVLLVIATFTLAAVGLSRSRDSQILVAERAAGNLARALHERVLQEVRDLDAALEGIAAMCTRKPCNRTDDPASHPALTQAQVAAGIGALYTLDAQGVLVSDTSSIQIPPLNLSDRDFFRAHLPRDQGLFVGRPAANPATGLWTISASRRLNDADGNFAGVVVAQVDPGRFDAVLGMLDVGREGVVALLHRDGSVLTHLPKSKDILGPRVAATALQVTSGADAAPAVSPLPAPMDGVARIFAVSPLPGLPLLVAVGLGRDEMLSPWFSDLKLFSMLAAVAIGLLVWLAARLLQEHGKRELLSDSLDHSQTVFRQVVDALPVGVWVADAQGRILLENDSSRRIWSREQSAEIDAEGLFRARWPGSDKALSPIEWGLVRALRIGETSRNEAIEIETRDGRVRTVLHSASPILGPGQEVVGAIAVNEDITERRTLIDQLRETEGRFVSLFEKNIDAMLLTKSDGTVLRANAEACHLLGYGEDELRILPANVFVDPEDMRFRVLMVDRFVNGHAKGEINLVRKDMTKFPVEISTSSFQDRSGSVCASVTVRDITERKRAEEHIEYIAYHDELTGIRNRAYFHRALEQAITIAQRHARSCGIMLVDLDRFKNINDSLGHQAGDSMLKEIASRLQSCVRESDIVARLGGDEFIVLVQDVGTPEQAAPIAHKILQSVCRPLLVGERDLLITASIGVSFFPNDGADSQTLLKHADTAMYRAKESGKNAFQFFSSEMHLTTLDRLALESGLHRALERNEFIMYYQPRMRVKDRKVAGVEALIRWHHPERGLINPNDFISIAEETGLIVPVGDWVLEDSCRYGRHLQDSGHPDLSVSVNLSARQLLDGRLADRIGDILDRTGFPSASLELEITESMVMHDADRAVLLLDKLRQTGVSVAIDDFGTGYSSLAYLKRFPINCVKIDRSFIRDLPADAGDGAITRSIIALAQNMDLNVVAEGVESEQQFDFLSACGCHEAQGYLFSAPMPPPALETYLEQARAA